MKIGVVCVPYINSGRVFDLMINTLGTIKSKHELKYYGVVNKCRDEDVSKLRELFGFLVFNDVNCLARAWNIGIKQAINDDCDYILVPNLDIELSDGCIDIMADYLEKHPEVDMVSGNVNNKVVPFQKIVTGDGMFDSYALFMIRRDLLAMMYERDSDNEPFKGCFDENCIPAYFEDLDFQTRLEKHGFVHKCVKWARFTHYRNTTISSGLDVGSASKEYFLRKWGGERGAAKYKEPFGDY